MISDATQLRLAEMVLENRATLNSLTKIVGNLVECAAQDGADPRLNYLVSTLDQMAAVRLYDGLEISKLRKELQNAES